MRSIELNMDDNANAQWGRDLPGTLQDKWPRTPEGDFEEPTFLKHCIAVDMQDELLVNMLGAYGVPCVRQYPCDGQFGKIILGMSGTGVDIYVPKSMLDDALTLCEGVPDDENV